MTARILLVILAALLTVAVPRAQTVIVPSPVPAYANGCLLQYDSATDKIVCIANAALSLPLSDASNLLADNGDGTKTFRIEVSGIATATNRVLTLPNANLSMTCGDDSCILATTETAQTFTQLQTFSNGLTHSGGTFTSASTGAISGGWNFTGARYGFGAATNTNTVASYAHVMVGGKSTFATYIGGDNPYTYIGNGFYLGTGGNTYRSVANQWVGQIALEDGGFTFSNASNAGAIDTQATLTTRFSVSNAGGVQIGSPTGGDKGAGTLNATAVYDDNVLLTDWVFDLHYDGVEQPSRTKVGDLRGILQPEPVERILIPRPAKRLYTIDDVKATTEKERRLPWMPTKNEFEQQRGAGWMITSLWQGQEQQQLYLFDHDAKLKALETTVAAQAKRIAALERP